MQEGAGNYLWLEVHVLGPWRVDEKKDMEMVSQILMARYFKLKRKCRVDK
jgi:hypothetical protein